MDYINQIHLIKKGIKKNKKFLNLLYNCDKLVDAFKCFSKLDCTSIGGQRDEDMTLKKFLKGVNSEAYIMLQIGSPDPQYIRYFVSFIDNDIKRYLDVRCSRNKHNLDTLVSLYKKSFGCKLKDEPILAGIIEYYKEHYE